jgi:predicted phage tail protein
MMTVLLYGHLRRAFGKYHRFAVRSPAEAVRALRANFPGFERQVLAHNEPGYHVLVGRESRDEKTLHHPADDVIRIVPVVAGAKRNGVFQTILGIVLIVVGTYFGMQPLIAAGVSMLLGGIVTMLSPQPKTKGPAEKPENLPSYGFDGATNTTAQGNPVPLAYGRIIVGSQVLSVGLSTDSI